MKAQHPTAQAVPGLYRKNGSSSHYLLHSDSDLKLDAQGSFTRCFYKDGSSIKLSYSRKLNCVHMIIYISSTFV